MAYSVNKAIVLGNVGQDPELRYTQSGTAVINLSVATESGTGDKKTTEWHRIVAWDKLAEIVGKFVKKGSKVYVEGHIKTREFTDKDGNKRWQTEIVAQEMVFLGGDKQQGDDRQEHEPARGRGGGEQQNFGGSKKRGNGGFDDDEF